MSRMDSAWKEFREGFLSGAVDASPFVGALGVILVVGIPVVLFFKWLFS
jgi:hypothetical protein